MKKPTQRETNPFKYSDSNKRYHTFDYYMKQRFGGKCARISLDAGFSCPNKDGTKSHGGCIFCYGGSSGAALAESLREQYEKGIEIMRRKWQVSRFVPYLQANTNSYAPLDTLRRVYSEAASYPDAVMLAIATRADCLENGAVELIREVSERIPVIVELGLQSVYDETAEKINRGHTYAEFLEGYNRLKAAGGDIKLCVHLINGLPGESVEMMINSAKTVAKLSPHMVKLHSLHVIEDTELCRMYENGEYTPMDREEYIETVCDQLEYFAPETVIARITGDAPENLLRAPDWCRRKTAVSNDIDKLLVARNSFQGKKHL
ncbi:MAG: TIGR01212 family radical SAM protein [Clostridia bacterium]|nr:TIGR01212 family radical SAM protein [Clostridia bacterium]